MKSFELHLREDEKSCATVEKYMRDLKRFMIFAGEKSVDKQLVLEYKESLAKSYAASSANSMLAVINSFFRFSGMATTAVLNASRHRQRCTAPRKKS